QPFERREDPVERLPRARRAAGAAVDDELVGPLRDLGVEVVLDHPERRLLRPREAGQLGPARCPDGAAGDRAHAGIAARTRSGRSGSSRTRAPQAANTAFAI